MPLDLPPRTLPTRACWYTLPLATLVAAGVEPHQVLGAVHAAEHALIGLLPLFTICDRWDVGGVSMAEHPADRRADDLRLRRLPGRRRDRRARVRAHSTATSRAAAELVAACPCDAGCPSCVQSPKCGNWNEYLDKAGAVHLLRLLAG